MVYNFSKSISQLFLVSHITLDEQCLLRFELLIQGSFTFYTCLKIPIHQRYLQTRKEGAGLGWRKHRATKLQTQKQWINKTLPS